MLILALETTGEICGVAVCDGDRILSERAFRHEMKLSQRLTEDVDTVLREAGVELTDLGGFGVGIGPGSFTGVRIGVMTAKTWASVLAKPIAGISSLQSLAVENSTSGRTLVPIVRARPGIVYAAFFLPESARSDFDFRPEVLSVTELRARIGAAENKQYLACGDGVPLYQELILELRADIALGTTNAPRASTIASLAADRIKAGATAGPIDLVPLYVAGPPIGPASGSGGSSA